MKPILKRNGFFKCMKLEQDFYLQDDVVEISKQLIGKVIYRKLGNQFLSAIISETEAYNGIVDKASHAYGGKRTSRTETMYAAGGITYVYLCYGIHRMLNIVTNKIDIPHAVLIRGIVPTAGKEIMLKNRNKQLLNKKDFVGPGKVAQALGIEMIDNNKALSGAEIWIEDKGIDLDEEKIKIGPRVGIDYAEEDALLPYRFQYLDF